MSMEVLCAECPELLEDLRRRIHAIEAMEGMLQIPPNSEMPAQTATSDTERNPQFSGYQLLDVLDRGGMGIVYRAAARETGPGCGGKDVGGRSRCPAGAPVADPGQAQAMAGLKHPNIVPLYEASEYLGRLYLVMELLEGGSLADRLYRALLPAGEAAELIRKLAWAVQHCHERGVVHRDLKPGNVLFTNDGTPKISDFGLARLQHEIANGQPAQLTQSGAVLGTACYMAPEQATGGKDAGPPVDIHALGAILYETLTGKPPFRGETTLDTLEQGARRSRFHRPVCVLACRAIWKRFA